jgi:hypothetical protein
MHRSLIAAFAILCLAVGQGGCSSKSNKDYDEIVMPAQTGSVLQRRVQVKKIDREDQPKEKKKKKASAPKPEPEEEPSATPAPQEESTPPTERFR